MPPTMGYRPDIDGLRAIAVLAVVLFHAGVAGFGGGFVGVDVFFVISGFLITKLIVDDPRFSLLAFYQRRARRILPALAVVVLATSVAAYIFFLPEEFLAFSKSVVATTLFSSNILFWHEMGYFDAASAGLQRLVDTFRTGASSSWKMSRSALNSATRSARCMFRTCLDEGSRGRS